MLDRQQKSVERFSVSRMRDFVIPFRELPPPSLSNPLLSKFIILSFFSSIQSYYIFYLVVLVKYRLHTTKCVIEEPHKKHQKTPKLNTKPYPHCLTPTTPGIIHFFIYLYFCEDPPPLWLIHIWGPHFLIHKMWIICLFFGTLPLSAFIDMNTIIFLFNFHLLYFKKK